MNAKPLTPAEERAWRVRVDGADRWFGFPAHECFATLNALREELAEERAMRRDLLELHARQRIMHAKIPARPILYTDVLGENQVCRDDLWAVTTEELNALAAYEKDYAEAVRMVSAFFDGPGRDDTMYEWNKQADALLSTDRARRVLDSPPAEPCMRADIGNDCRCPACIERRVEQAEWTRDAECER